MYFVKPLTIETCNVNGLDSINLRNTEKKYPRKYFFLQTQNVVKINIVPFHIFNIPMSIDINNLCDVYSDAKNSGILEMKKEYPKINTIEDIEKDIKICPKFEQKSKIIEISLNNNLTVDRSNLFNSFSMKKNELEKSLVPYKNELNYKMNILRKKHPLYLLNSSNNLSSNTNIKNVDFSKKLNFILLKSTSYDDVFRLYLILKRYRNLGVLLATKFYDTIGIFYYVFVLFLKKERIYIPLIENMWLVKKINSPEDGLRFLDKNGQLIYSFPHVNSIKEIKIINLDDGSTANIGKAGPENRNLVGVSNDISINSSCLRKKQLYIIAIMGRKLCFFSEHNSSNIDDLLFNSINEHDVENDSSEDSFVDSGYDSINHDKDIDINKKESIGIDYHGKNFKLVKHLNPGFELNCDSCMELKYNKIEFKRKPADKNNRLNFSIDSLLFNENISNKKNKEISGFLKKKRKDN